MRLNPRPDDGSLERLQKNALGDAESEVGSFEAGNTNTHYPGMLARTLRRFGFPEASGRLLDIGCGSGDLLAAVCDHLNASGTGLEMAQESLVRARKRFTNLEWILGWATTDNISTSTFDAIALIHVLEHFTEPLEALRAIFEGLKPGGLLVVEVPNGEFYFSRTYSVLFETPKAMLAPLYRMRKRIVPFTARRPAVMSTVQVGSAVAPGLEYGWVVGERERRQCVQWKVAHILALRAYGDPAAQHPRRVGDEDDRIARRGVRAQQP